MKRPILLVFFLGLGLYSQAFARTNPATWMEQIYSAHPEKRLIDIAIPGSHDTGTDQMTSSSGFSARLDSGLRMLPKSAILAWSKTQDRNLYQQLNDGIRYFDMRVENTSRGWMTYHGLLSNQLKPMIEQLADFVWRHPREIIILDFQSLVNFHGDVTELVDYFRSHPVLGSRIAEWNHYNSGVRFGDLWDDDKSLIIMMSERNVRRADGSLAATNFVWPRALDNPWPNTRHTAEVKKQLLEGIGRRNPNRFYVSQAIVTPDAHVIALGWFQGITSLRDMAIKWMNPKYRDLIPELNREARRHNRHLNIVISDFYQHGGLVDLILQVNTQNLN